MTLAGDGTDGTDRMAMVAVVVAAVAMATILGAYFFEFVLGYAPCPLCLDQRIPYYVAIPFAVAVALGAQLGAPRLLLAGGLAVAAVAMLIGAGLGVYHSGVEWKWWAGPSDCSGPINSFGTAGGLLETIETTPVVRCDEAAWRLLGLSLAGYNVLISTALAGIALWGAAAAAGDRKST
ncbi:MAG: disulfide bond formation protein B [Rhizobiales bacterium]|nr:disulfide bond formation protein B [Hyphomicrobiales bacterium]